MSECDVITLYEPRELRDETGFAAKMIEAFLIDAHVVDGHQHEARPHTHRERDPSDSRVDMKHELNTSVSCTVLLHFSLSSTLAG